MDLYLDNLELVAPYLFVVVGLVVGSFLNVVVYRIPAGLSVVSPPSACPNCGTQIKPYDNLPVVSWLILRGKCRSCQSAISARYPLVEAANAALFLGVYLVIGSDWTVFAYVWFAGVTLVLGLIDFDTKRIPNRILFPGAFIGALLLGAGALGEGEMASYGRSWLAALAYFSGFLILALIVPAGFGMGDVKLAFFLGMFAGYVSWAVLVVAVFGAVFIGGGVSILLLITRRVSRKDAIPFGPSMVVGAWVAIAFGNEIARSYLGLG
ncbi:MAG: prepilin peptidase [Acidimicrobiia bacterium]|nr:prepilin peptidase [Acidimicrobiia bacterium]